MTVHDNTPTVAVCMVPMDGGLLMIRRALTDGFGKLAIPGGWQVRPQSLQQAAVDEVHQETGVVVDPASLKLVDARTVPNGAMNLIFYEAPETPQPAAFSHDHEVQEVLIVHEPVETAFPLHTEQVVAFFERRRATTSPKDY